MAPRADEPDRDAHADLHLVGDSDGELLSRVAARDVDAFEILYRRYVRPVYALARRSLGERGGAEDATRRAFVAVWRAAAAAVPERGDGAHWLFTVVCSAIAREPGADPPAEDGWLAFRVHAAVAELPEQERVPLELAYWDGRSSDEIAEVLGLPAAVVEARTRSALARLAVRLEGLS